MSPKQTSLYWRTWNAVCTAHGWRNNDTPHRRALHARAGCPPSMRDFTNSDLDRYLSYSRQLLGSREDTEVAAEKGARKRLLRRIEIDASAAGLSDSYIRSISTALNGLADYRDLSIADLTNLRDAIHNRASTRLGADTRTTARTSTPARTYLLRPALTP